jgi:phospholipase C
MRPHLQAALIAALAAAGCSGSAGSPTLPGGPAQSAASPIKHIIVMIQENRSFDNLFAGFPGADATLHGKCKPEGLARKWCTGSHVIQLHAVKLESTGTSPSYIGMDIDHSHRGFEIECDPNAMNVCRMDGFDLINQGESGGGLPAELYPYAYVERGETLPYWKLAKQYALADKMFDTDTASSFISHQLMISGTVRINDDESLTDQPNTQPWGCDAQGPESGPNQQAYTPVIFRDGRVNATGPFPCFDEYKTIADLLVPANVSYKFYVAFDPGLHHGIGDFSGSVWNGFDAIKKIACVQRHENASRVYVCTRGPDWVHIKSPNTQIFSDLSDGKLASLSYVIPTLYDSDHPASGCNGGPLWVTKVVNAVGSSRYWQDTAIVLFWDDWGGWYDNVPPPQVNYTSLGMRVPMIVISPYAKPHYISHTLYNFGSILKLIEKNFHLGSLGTTDASSNSMEDMFDFKQRPLKFTRAPIPKHMPCAGKLTNPGSVDDLIRRDGGIPE